MKLMPGACGDVPLAKMLWSETPPWGFMVTFSTPKTDVMPLCVVGRFVVTAAVSRSPSVAYDPTYITRRPPDILPWVA